VCASCFAEGAAAVGNVRSVYISAVYTERARFSPRISKFVVPHGRFGPDLVSHVACRMAWAVCWQYQAKPACRA